MVGNPVFLRTLLLPPNKILKIVYLWLMRNKAHSICVVAEVSNKTVTDWCNHLRSLVTWDLQTLDIPEGRIGGVNVVVEMDESKFGKRKYHQGRRVEGVWVVGAGERIPQRRMFAISVDDRSRETLHAIIERCHAMILPGSIVHTDCWAAYEGMEAHGIMAHGTVNHTHNYVDPDTGVHTNTIEGTWNGIKLNTNRRHYNRDFVDGNVHTFI